MVAGLFRLPNLNMNKATCWFTKNCCSCMWWPQCQLRVGADAARIRSSGLNLQATFASTFGREAIAEWRNQISVGQESDCLLNDFVWGFIRKSLVESSHWNMELPTFPILIVKEVKYSSRQRIDLNHRLPYPCKKLIHQDVLTLFFVNNVTVPRTYAA